MRVSNWNAGCTTPTPPNNLGVPRMQGYSRARYNSYSYYPDRNVRVGCIEGFLRKKALLTYIHQIIL